MPSATFIVSDEWANYMATKKVDCSADTFKVGLTNTALVQATTKVKADLTPITANGGGEKTLTVTWAETGSGTGVWRFSIAADQVWTASGGSFGPFQYAYIYDDTPAGTPTDPLVGWFDYGSAITPADTETFDLDVDANFAVFTLTFR